MALCVSLGIFRYVIIAFYPSLLTARASYFYSTDSGSSIVVLCRILYMYARHNLFVR